MNVIEIVDADIFTFLIFTLTKILTSTDKLTQQKIIMVK